MDFALLFLGTLFNLFILIAHFSMGLNNPISDLLASIPNLILGLIYFMLGFIISFYNNKIGLSILKFESFFLSICYIVVYLWFPANLITLNSTKYTNNLSNYLTICDQNTRKATALQSTQFWQMIRMNKCDILVLQEVINSDYYKTILQDHLQTILKTNYRIINFGEFVIISRYPIKLEQISSYGGFISALIDAPNQQIRVINIHIWTPLESRTSEIDPFISYPTPPFTVRKQQTKELVQYLQLHQYDTTPNIMIGDFNMLPTHSFIYKTLKFLHFYRIKNTKFLTPTFSTSLPIIEIDHTFSNQPDIIKKRILLLSSPSDHAMQVLKLNIFR